MNELIKAYSDEVVEIDYYAMLESSWEKQKRITIINDDLEQCDYYINQSIEEHLYEEQMDCLRPIKQPGNCQLSDRLDCFRSLSSDERQFELDKISFAEMCRAGWNEQEGCATEEDIEINEKCKIVEHDNIQKSHDLFDIYSQNKQLTQEVFQLTEKLIRQQHLNDLMFENIQLIFNKQFKTKQETCAFIQSKEYEENEAVITRFLAEYTRIRRWFEKDEFVWEESVEASVDGSLADSAEESYEDSVDNEDSIIIIDDVDL